MSGDFNACANPGNSFDITESEEKNKFTIL